MDLYSSPASPFARKVRILAIETGQDDAVNVLNVAFTPISPHPDVTTHNPVGKVPTLVTGNGTAIHDSRVICEFLDAMHSGKKMFPPTGIERWQALKLQSIGDAIMDAGVLMRYETTDRPGKHFWENWYQGQKAKAERAVAVLEDKVVEFDGKLNIGTIALGCALGYLDFRFPEQINWREGHPNLTNWYENFVRRSSMRATMPAG